jgi:hypothetical protein
MLSIIKNKYYLIDTYSVNSQLTYYDNLISKISCETDLDTNKKIINNSIIANINKKIDISNLNNLDNFYSENFDNFYSENFDTQEGSSNLVNNINKLQLPSEITKEEIESLSNSHFNYHFPKNISLNEIFSLEGNNSNNSNNTTYLGAVDEFGNLHLSADVLEDPYYNSLIPGTDFTEGFDSFIAYDHDSIYFKEMIELFYKNNSYDKLLEFYNTCPDYWFHRINRIAAKKLLKILVERNEITDLDVEEAINGSDSDSDLD